MGLPTNPYKAVETLCNKDLFREFLKSHGFNTPKAVGFKTKEEAIDYVSKSDKEAAMRNTTLEDVFVYRIGRGLGRK